MEVKEKSKKRELIKSVAIVFLVILLLLTFFSNTIMNRSLPEVATQSITSGTISAKIRGSGTVTANESYEVIINQTREVRSICVQVGDMVSQGDLLFILGDMESEELKSAQEQLDSLNLQYQQQLLTLSREYASDDRALQVLREDLERAAAQRDANLVADGEIANVKSAVEAARSDLTQIGLALEELQAYMEESGDVAAAQQEVDTWEASVEAAQADVEQYEKDLEALVTTGSVDSQRAIEDAKAALAEAENTWQSLWIAYEDEMKFLVAAVWQESTTPSNVDAPDVNGRDPEPIGEEQQIYINAYLTGLEEDEEYAAAYEALIGAQKDMEKKEQALDRLKEDEDELYGSAREQREALEDQLAEAEDQLAEAETRLRQAKMALEQTESRQSALKSQISAMEATQREKTAQESSLTEELAALEEKKELYDQAVALVAEKERAIADALTGKNIDKQLDDLDLESLRKQIENAQALVDRYTQDSVDTEITANVSGLITSINVSAGKETTAGMAMAVIDVVDRGYLIRIPVTNEQSRQVRVGDTASVTNYYWGSNVEATLEAITADPANPGTGKLLVFRVTGDIDAGSNITLSIGQRSANYDTIIPKSALREDTNGYFVLVITVKSSPLSNRYIATRVDVQVLAEDDTSAAVSGLSAGDFVITTSSKPVEPGMQVRMVENP